MTRHWHLTAVSVVLTVALPLGIGAAEREEKTFNVGEAPTIILINYSGLISVEGGQQKFVKIIGIRHSENVEIDTEASPRRVRVTSHVLDRLATAENTVVDYELYVPERSNLEIRSNMGDVAVRNIRGQVSVDVVEAAVKVEGVEGYINACSLGRKAVEVTQSKGTIQATTVIGDIVLDQLESNNVKANSTLGNITYKGDFMEGGSYNLSSTDGQISVFCDEEASVEWEARTVKGSIKTNLPIKSKKHRPLWRDRQSLLGTLNEGAATVQLSTFSGPIQIRRQSSEEF
jgi:hypothetical protein